MQLHTYSWLKSFLKDTISLIDRQIAVNHAIGYEEQSTRRILELRERLAADDFKVLLMGIFSSGKSTFLNALLGQYVLPARMLPSTATICEVRYGRETKCILYPRIPYTDASSGIVRTTQFEIKLEDLDRYILIKHGTGVDLDEEAITSFESPFSKMVLEWPLGICKDGVELIDSPGLDDPDSHDRITHEYLETADTVIYCMPSLHTFSKTDKDTITYLKGIGYKSIIFIITGFDRIHDPLERADFQNKTTQKLSRYTEFGTSGVFFVNSVGAIENKINNRPDPEDETGIGSAERQIEKHLVEQVGTGKLVRSTTQLSMHNSSVSAFINSKIELSALKLEDLIIKHARANEILLSAKQNSEFMVAKLELGIAAIIKETSNQARQFLLTLPSKVDEWMSGFTPSTKITIRRLKPNVRASVQEHIDHIKSKLAMENGLWTQEVLNPLIKSNLGQVAIDTDDLQKSYDKSMKELRISLNFESLDASTDGLVPSNAERFGSLLIGFVTGDFIAGTVGYTFGFRGLITTIVSQVTAGVILGIASLFTPIGFTAFIVTSIASAMVSGGLTLYNIQPRIKKDVTKKMKEGLAGKEIKDKIVGDIQHKLETALGKITEAAKTIFAEDRLPLEKAMEDALAKKQEGEDASATESAHLNEMKGLNSKIASELGLLMTTAKLTKPKEAEPA